MRWRVFLAGLVCLTLLGLVRASDPQPLQIARDLYFDRLQRQLPRAGQPLPIRVVDIDEASLASLGQWPWPRDLLARLVERLGQMNAAAIVFDVLFSEPDRLSPSVLAADPRLSGLVRQNGSEVELPDNDASFAAAMADRPVVLGVAQALAPGGSSLGGKAGIVQIGTDPAARAPRLVATTPLVPGLAEAANGIGGINVSPSGGASAVRRIPLIWRTDGGLLPSLALEALRVAQGEASIILVGAPGTAGILEAVRVGAFEIPTTSSGELWVRYRPDDDGLYISAQDLLREDAGAAGLAPLIDGHIVLVGTSAAGLLDIRTTALGENVPGVSIHAQAVEQIITGDFLFRADWTEGLELAAFLLIGGIAVLVMSVSGPFLSIAAGGAAAAAALAGSWIAFSRFGVLLDASFPIIGGSIVFLMVTTFRFAIADREKRMIRRSFAHYVAPAVLERIERGKDDLALGGEVRDVTVLFTDIRNFTGLSETLEADQLVTMLNSLFTELTEEILAEEGTIDKFIGDSIMAFWNAPLEMPDHKLRACRAALRMRRALAQFNSRLVDGRRPVSIGIGVNSGRACVGNIGSRSRFNYSVIGDSVNVASRVEGACRRVGYDALISGATAEGAGDCALLNAGWLALRGRSKRVESFILVGDAAVKEAPAFQDLARCHAELIAELASSPKCPERTLAKCRQAAALVDEGLPGFYDTVPQRLEDFSSAPIRGNILRPLNGADAAHPAQSSLRVPVG